jgi:hypothetical protein
MNQKPNSLKVDLRIRFETSLEVRNLIKWLVPIVFGLVQLAIRHHGGS